MAKRAKKTVALQEAPSSRELKLDLGCGQTPKEGFVGVDKFSAKAERKVDLFKFPWPFLDASVDEIYCSHFLEHIPAREVEERDLDPLQRLAGQRFLGQDMFFAFMDECWRILKPDAFMDVVVPCGRSNRGFQDPTHRRFFMQETFVYLSRSWRESQKLDHYPVRCNFEGSVNMMIPAEESLRAAEVQAQRFATCWNVISDWIAKLKRLP